MLQASSLPDPTLMLEHVKLVLNGRVSPWLLWEKDPVALAGTAMLALILLLLTRRLLFGTRPKIVIRQASGMGGRGRGGRCCGSSQPRPSPTGRSSRARCSTPAR
jgi:hypothetical protein